MPPADLWPIDTPPTTILDLARKRAADLTRRQRVRWTAVSAAATAAVAAVGLLITPSDLSTVRTTPADGSGTGEETSAAPDAEVLVPGDESPAGPSKPRPVTRGSNVHSGPTGAATTVPSLPGTSTSTTSTTAPSPNPRQGTIAFARDGRIWIVESDGSGVAPLTSPSPETIDEPDWAPDGARLVAVAWHTDVTAMPVGKLVIVGLDGGIRPFTEERKYKSPKWAPDGAVIAFARNVAAPGMPPQYELWTVHPDGSNERRIAENVDASFSWSPDGKRLVAGCQGGLCTMTSDGSDVRLIPNTSNHLAPVWSPDGSRIVAGDLGEGKVVTMRLDGTDRRVVADGTTTQLDWSPDGQTIVFASGDSYQGSCSCNRLWRVNADGSDRAPITDGARSDYAPSWKRA